MSLYTKRSWMTQRIPDLRGLIILSDHGRHDSSWTMDRFLDITHRMTDSRPPKTTQNTPVRHNQNQSHRNRFQSWWLNEMVYISCWKYAPGNDKVFFKSMNLSIFGYSFLFQKSPIFQDRLLRTHCNQWLNDKQDTVQQWKLYQQTRPKTGVHTLPRFRGR
jgi:hypothetical protein